MQARIIRNVQGLVIGSVLLALGAVTFEALRTIQHERRTEVAEILSAADGTAQKLADRTTEVFDRVNQATLLVKYLDEKGSLPPLSSLRDAGVISNELVQFIYVADRRGFIVDSTAGLSAANVADEDFFKRHRREPELEISIAPVWVNPIGGAQGIPVTRRLTPGAAFEGVVTATVNPAALSVTYARTEARGTAIGILGADGIFRSRTVDGKLTVGERADPARVVQRAAEIHATGVPVKSPLDGVSRFVAVVKLERYPLYAVVAVDADQALAAYRHTREKVVTWAAVVAAGVLLSGWIVLIQARRLDLSQRRTKKAEIAFRATLEGSLDAVTLLAAQRDGDGALQDLKVIDCNTHAASLVGKGREQIVGRRLCELAPSMAGFLVQFDRVIRSQQCAQAELPATEPHLLGRWLHHQLVPLEDGVALITRDVTDKKLAEEALASLARIDALTQLSNRRHFEEVLETARARALRSGEPLALLYIDLDGFKTINDTLGHAAGDIVLAEVARRLRSQIRETDLVARLGGDEFAVIAERAGSLLDVAELSERVLASLREPHEVGGHAVTATPSIGVAIFDAQESCETLCSRSDAAMYRAKLAGKSRFEIAAVPAESLRRSIA